MLIVELIVLLCLTALFPSIHSCGKLCGIQAWSLWILGLFGSPSSFRFHGTTWAWHRQEENQAHQSWDKAVPKSLGVGFRIYSLSQRGCAVPVLNSVTFWGSDAPKVLQREAPMSLKKDWQGWETIWERMMLRGFFWRWARKEVNHSKVFSSPLLGGGKYHSTLKKPGYRYSDFYKYQR